MAKSRAVRLQSTPDASSGIVRSPGAAYLDLSAQPLHVLVFLIPLVAFYEIGSVLYLSDPGRGVVETVAAQRLLAEFFETFGAFGLYLPGLALVTVLLVQHVVSRNKWVVRPRVIGVMVVESLVWTAPLILLAIMLGPTAAVGLQGEDGAPPTIHLWPWQARLTISIGAGLYEELLFRMVLIAAVHLVAVDLIRLKDRAGKVIALIVSALAFAFYHDPGPDAAAMLGRVTFFAIAGLYFGMLYLGRGFGIVVAVHVLYDVMALLVIGRD